MLGCVSYRIPSWCKPQHPCKRRGSGTRNQKNRSCVWDSVRSQMGIINQSNSSNVSSNPIRAKTKSDYPHPPSVRSNGARPSRRRTKSKRMTTNLLNVIFCQCLRCNIHSILLHLLAHISILNHSLSLFRHGGFCLLWLRSAIDCLIKNKISRALTTSCDSISMEWFLRCCVYH